MRLLFLTSLKLFRGRRRRTPLWLLLAVTIFFGFIWFGRNEIDYDESTYVFGAREVGDRRNIHAKTRVVKTDKTLKADQTNQQCREKRNFVYIKMIKCASETLTSIFRRFGYYRNLSFVLPPGDKIYIGWPYLIEDSFYRPSKTGEFNILCEHSVYNEEIMSSIMPADAVYITSIRDPFSQFKSMFNYYKLGQIIGINTPDPITEYLHNLEKYEAIYKSAEVEKHRYCIPNNFSMSKNLMSFNLGLPLGYPPGSRDFSRDDESIEIWLRHLESRFQLVMLVENLDESLVLLKRYMCWTVKDILYHARNVGQYSYRDNIIPENLKLYKQWSNIDYILYDHFLKVFWKKVAAEGPDFMDEVHNFKTIQRELSSFCSKGEKLKNATLTIEKSKWNERFTLPAKFCETIQKGLLEEVKLYYDNLPQVVPTPKPRVNFC